MSDKKLALFETRENLDYYIFCYDEFICLIDNYYKFYHWVKDKYNISDVEYNKLLDGEVVNARGCELFIGEVDVV